MKNNDYVMSHLALLISLWGVAVAGYCTDDFFSTVNVSQIEKPANLSSRFSNTFTLQEKLSYGLSDPGNPFSRSTEGFGKFETSLQWKSIWQPVKNTELRFVLEYFNDQVYEINDSLEPTSAELSEFRNRFDVRDAYLDTQISENFYLRIGNQIIPWGFSEVVSINDVVSIKDQYTAGQADLEDLRLQVPAIKLSTEISQFTFDFILTYEAGSHRFAPENNEFDPFIALRSSGVFIREENPENPVEYFFRLNRTFNSGDLNIYFGDANNNEYSLTSINTVSVSGVPKTTLSFNQDRFQILGLSASYVTGFWVLKNEFAFHNHVELSPSQALFFSATGGWEDRDQIKGMVGLEYAGLDQITLFLEINGVRTSGDTARLLVDKNETGIYLSGLWQHPNEKAQIQIDGSQLLSGDDYIYRVTGEYAWTDEFKTGTTVVVYDSTDPNSFFHSYRRNDVAQVYFKYSF